MLSQGEKYFVVAKIFNHECKMTEFLKSLWFELTYIWQN